MFDVKDLSWLKDSYEDKKKRYKNVKKPKLLEGETTLIPFLSFYYSAFWELCTERRTDGYIPWTSIRKYCEVWGVIDSYEFDEFVRIIRAMDKAYMKHQQKERDKDMKKPSK